MLTWDSSRIEKIVYTLTAAYYMSSVVKQALDYPGQMRRPVAEATRDERFSDELIAPVIERGPVYVPVDDLTD